MATTRLPSLDATVVGRGHSIANSIVTHPVKASKPSATIAQAVSMPQLPELQQPPGHVRGQAIPGGVNPRGALQMPSVEYPDNSRLPAAALLAPNVIIQQLGLAQSSLSQPLHLKSVRLKHFHTIGNTGFRDLTVSPDRLTYEVTTAFSTPISAGGNRWSAGERVFAVDAQTGHVFWSETSGSDFVPSLRKLLRPRV